MQNKLQIRKEMKELLSQWPRKKFEQAGLALADKFSDIDKGFQENKWHSVLLYMPLPDEIPTGYLLQRLFEAHYPVYVPRLVNAASEAWPMMDFIQIHGQTSWIDNQWGIPEPDTASNVQWDCRPSLMLVPGLAFSFNGIRLGRGAGYYDRFIQEKEKTCSLVKIGVAFQEQCFSDLPCDAWDRKMDFVWAM